MHTIIVVQFYHPDSPAIVREQHSLGRAVGDMPVHLSYRNIFSDAWTWHDPCSFLDGASGLILGGSTAFFDGNLKSVAADRNDAKFAHDRSKDILRHVAEHDIPTLGICFGHQLMAHHHGGAVQRDETQSKIGTHAVTRTCEIEEDCLFAEIPDTFHAQYIHKDAVTTLPEGARVIARGPRCSFAALRYGKNRYSVQFHPEFDREHMELVVSAYPDYLRDINSGEMPEVLENEHTADILKRFVARCCLV